MYEANQIGRQLAVVLGFEDISQAYINISRDGHGHGYVSAKHQSKRIIELEQQLLKQQEAGSNLRKALQDMAVENEELRAKLRQAETTKASDLSVNAGTRLVTK